MHKFFEKLTSALLAVIVFTLTIMANTTTIYAQEDMDFYLLESMASALQEQNDQNVEIKASRNIVSFGHVNKGTPTYFQELTVTNTGDVSIYLDWQLCDAEDIFYVATSDNMSLAPYQSATLYIGMDEDKNAGYYTANLILCPLDHISATVNVGISAEIVSGSGRITYMGIKPSSLDLSNNSSYRFSAEVRGDNNPDTNVKWSVEGNTSTNTKIDNTGYLVIGQNETASEITVRAISVQDSNWTTTAKVRIQTGTVNVSTSTYPVNGGSTGGGGAYTPGSNVEVYAAPNNGYRFVMWTRNGQTVSTDPKYYINNIRENYELVANFEQVNCYVKVNAVHPEGGMVSDSGNVAYNGAFNLLATAKSGYEFEGWYEGGNRISGNNQLTINNIVTNREFTANFVQNAYRVQLQATPGSAGAVSGEGSFNKGTKVTVVAKPTDGYEFDCWTSGGNVVSKDFAYTIPNIDKDYVLVAYFKPKSVVTYSIEANVAEGSGTISPEGIAYVPEGQDITYSFAPAKNYTISSVIVDGKNLGAVPGYTFKRLNSNHSVEVKFVQILDVHVHSDKKSESHDEIVDNSSVQNKDVVDNEEEYKPSTVEEEAIDAFFDYTELTGVLQEFDVSKEEARALIRNKQDRELLEKACEEQYLAVTVMNEYADNRQETENASYMDVKSIPNFEKVVDSLLSEDEKMYIFEGGRIGINFSLYSNNKLGTDENKMLFRKAIKDKYEIGNLFEVILMKDGMEGMQVVTELDVPMVIEMNIPPSIKAEGREFLVMREHTGADGTTVIDYLQNESADPEKLVFTTDRFSSYAIVYKGGENTPKTQMDYAKILILIIAFAILLNIVLAILLIKKTKKHKKKKK